MNPFDPDLEDEGNLSSALGVFDMFCRVYRNEANLSNFTKWFVAFFDASAEGGMVYEGIMFAASMLPFPSPAMVAKLGATLAKMGKAFIGAMKAIWKGVKAVGSAVKTTITTMATRIADLAVSTWYNAEIALHDLSLWIKSGLTKFVKATKELKRDLTATLERMGLARTCAVALIVACVLSHYASHDVTSIMHAFGAGRPVEPARGPPRG